MAGPPQNPDALRQSFLDYFAARGHTIVPSAGLIPHHPTAPLFTNSGMMQFVPFFLGEERPPFRRAASVQKCVRLSGKHNDVDEVGRTRRHLTFFEMLGNWSFGDYFKEDAIRWAWEFVTEVAGFDGDRVWVTVHTSDDEAQQLWHDVVGFPLDRIQRLGDDENFWQMGETGPCGPDSELHYDCGAQWGDAGGPARGGSDRYVEFWNLVFMQNFKGPDGELSDLPQRNIDTGLGFERWLMLRDDVPTAFDTGVLRPLVADVERLSSKRYGADETTDYYLRVVADHARSMTFLVSDGVAPSNEDRGYVLRSVIRRAIRRGYQLGIDRMFLSEMVDGVVGLMGSAYPELVRNHDAVGATIEREEARFRDTLRAGNGLLDAELDKGAITGAVAFRLHDTFGFPIELTEELAGERGVPVDRAGFDAEMEAQRQRAKAATRREVVKGGEAAYREVLDEHGPTEFTGYAEYETKARVLAVVPGAQDMVELFLDRTPFYAEGGGQVGDTGTITGDTARAVVVDTTYALPGLSRHVARVVEGSFPAGAEVVAAVDVERREAIRRNHTGTHLLHWALREVLGPQVKQQSSYVGPDRLRFDINHHAPLTPAELHAVERLVNARVLADEPVRAYETSKGHAEELGAIAFFGDKYGDFVRVVEAGTRSMELCGGTHVGALGMIGPLKIVGESSIGSNLRRIEAITGMATLERLDHDEGALQRAAELLKATPEELTDAIERLLQRERALRDELQQLRGAAARDQAAELAAQAENGVVVARVDGLAGDQLKDLAVAVREQPGIAVAVIVGSPDGQRAALAAALAPGIPTTAGELLGPAAKLVGGGMGKADRIGVTGGRDASRLDDAVASVRARLAP